MLQKIIANYKIKSYIAKKNQKNNKIKKGKKKKNI